MKKKSQEKKGKSRISLLKTLKKKLPCLTPRKKPTAVLKRKFQEKISHLKTPKATSLSGSVSNCRYNSAEVRQKTMEDSISQVERIPEIENADKEDELKESNASLSLQLNESRKKTVELKSFIQKLEETIEQQNLDMEIPENLTAHIQSSWLNDEASVIYMRNILSLYRTTKRMSADVKKLKKKLKVIEDGEHWKPIKNIKLYYEMEFNAQESEISRLKARLLESVPETCKAEAVCRNVGDADLLEQTEELKEKDHEHEMGELNPKNAAIEDESKKSLEESNASLSLKLNKSREENVSLGLVIQKLKVIIVQQKLHMEKPEVRSLWLIKQEHAMYLRYINWLRERGDTMFAEMETLKKKVGEIEETNNDATREKKISEIKMDYERKIQAQKEEILRLKEELNVTC